MPKATICSKELTADGCFLHLSTDNGIVRVSAPLDVAHRAELGVEVEIPDGDISDPHVQAGITWTF